MSATASENHHWNASVPNQLTLKRGVPDAPGAEVFKIENGGISKEVLGASGVAAEKHFWDNSAANLMSLKRGTPTAPGAEVLKVENGKVNFTAGVFGFSFTTTNTGGGSQFCLQLPAWLNNLKIQWGNQSITSNTDIIFAVPFVSSVHGALGTLTPGTAPNEVHVLSLQVSGALDKMQGFVSKWTGSWAPGTSQCAWLAIGV